MLLILTDFLSNSGLGRDYAWGDQHHLQSLTTYTMMAMQLIKTQLHGLPVELEAKAGPTELELTDPLGFHWKVSLSWVHNPSGVLALYRDQLDAQTHDQVIVD